MDAILLSGGIDSIALAAWLRPGIAITVDYGQLSAEAEIRSAAHVARELSIAHHTITANCRSLGSGDLAGTAADRSAPASEWWPFRNQLLVTLAGMLAIRLQVDRLFLGTVKTDSFHADGTPRFIDALDSLCGLQEGAIRVSAPAIEMTSCELIVASGVGVEILSWAHSCHKGSWACGYCRGCCKHREIMQELGYGSY